MFRLAFLTAVSVAALQPAAAGQPVVSSVESVDAGQGASITQIVFAPASPHAEREISREEAVTQVQSRFKARVVRADTVDEDGHRFYVMRLLSEGGKVWTVRFDAQSGEVR